LKLIKYVVTSDLQNLQEIHERLYNRLESYFSK